ncbi:MmcQ/YjbR family DNA-binding protein [Streptomyces sp. AC627_RSS907]|uniref:MmcQ/YjbR family DNA-binding protein n=1 Tax=Streptomyces sp. AC627_RSS907 TaxID=2823684 RepID=UPI001C231041|nr:MmcQ/YjbR family DNA-binding protein [Streptomyces sp. AC627_RSS907]
MTITGKRLQDITTDDPDEQIITVKAEPDRARYLRQEHDCVTPGRYLDKRHWISVGAGQGITTGTVRDLVGHSYDLVLDSVPRKRRPGKRDSSRGTAGGCDRGRPGHLRHVLELLGGGHRAVPRAAGLCRTGACAGVRTREGGTRGRSRRGAALRVPNHPGASPGAGRGGG